jgi:type III pantothenate kinase
MTPDVVVDVGNTRIKWGRCAAGRLVGTASLPPDSPDHWQRQIDSWRLAPGSAWVLTGVHPARRDYLRDWLTGHDQRVTVLSQASGLPIVVVLDRPDRVGIDRLLDAVAALSDRQPGQPAAIVDAGSAVTVDWLDADGAFRGGAIVPGMRLMAQALHNFTAQLPLVELNSPEPPLPGSDTLLAIEAGIFWTVVGGVRQILERLCHASPAEPRIFLTGGDAARLSPLLKLPHRLWPEMTLEGVRLAAEALP